MDAPRATGSRLALVVGSSMTLDVLAELAAGDPKELTVETRSGPVRLLDVGHALVLHRHDATPEGYRPPHRIDHHRSVEALAVAGCRRVLALCSVGSLRGWPVGTLVAPFDFYAPQVNPTFHEGAAGHSIPGFDEPWRDRVLAAWDAHAANDLLDGGVYAQTTGPRFETPAEVRALAMVADVVGMTMAAEAILASEAGLAYAAVCMVDNVGNGLSDTPLSTDDFHAGVLRNRARLVDDLRAVLPHLAPPTAGGTP
jgi:5'-methylthioadenosine phosphorylase